MSEVTVEVINSSYNVDLQTIKFVRLADLDIIQDIIPCFFCKEDTTNFGVATRTRDRILVRFNGTYQKKVVPSDALLTKLKDTMNDGDVFIVDGKENEIIVDEKEPNFKQLEFYPNKIFARGLDKNNISPMGGLVYYNKKSLHWEVGYFYLTSQLENIPTISALSELARKKLYGGGEIKVTDYGLNIGINLLRYPEHYKMGFPVAIKEGMGKTFSTRTLGRTIPELTIYKSLLQIKEKVKGTTGGGQIVPVREFFLSEVLGKRIAAFNFPAKLIIDIAIPINVLGATWIGPNKIELMLAESVDENTGILEVLQLFTSKGFDLTMEINDSENWENEQ